MTVTVQMNAAGAGPDAIAIGARLVDGALRLNYNVVDAAGSRISSGLSIPITIDVSTNAAFAGAPYLKVRHYLPASSSFETLSAFTRVGSTTVYTGTLNVNEDLVLEAPSGNTLLDVLALNGVSLLDISSIDISGHITSVLYSISVLDPTATIAYSGTTGVDLSGSFSTPTVGSNTFTFTVTAEDGSQQIYTRTVHRLSNDTGATITVDGNSVSNAGTISLSSTVSAPLFSITLAAGASRTDLSGSTTTGLQPGGSYSYSFTVTAADGTTADYSFYVRILSNATGLTVFTVNGVSVTDGGVVDLSASVTQVDISAAPVAGATIGDISGQRTGLVPGATYTYTFRVTAEDVAVWKDYSVYVRILSNATGLTVFTVNGISVTDGGVVDLSASVTQVDISAVPVTGASISAITGNMTGLVPGATYTYTFRVTAEDVAVWKDYSVSVRIAQLPSQPPPSGLPCIPAGQRVLTPTGYRPIESLRQGDMIKTPDGRAVPVRVFTTTVEKTTPETAPIRIGPLRLSPNHTFKIGKGWMFPLIAVNYGLHGAVREAPGAAVTYYHLETPNYLSDDLVVEGVVVESYGAKFVKAHGIRPEELYTLSSRGPYFVRIRQPHHSKRIPN
jgi:hypothetical protein